MKNSVNDRIRFFTKSNNTTLKELCSIIGIAQGTLTNMFSRGTLPSFNMLDKILKAYPELSADWLITGEGRMLKSEHNIVDDNNISNSEQLNGTSSDTKEIVGIIKDKALCLEKIISETCQCNERNDKQLTEKDLQINKLIDQNSRLLDQVSKLVGLLKKE
ncbi:MAG: helix-turn-helix domain-containing protein [Prevotella sp.]|jgi:transcriptional regulator with XRE-family HTH domain|nr:helix-turn-helix domain-containing protein [Prevotella sp.]